MFTGIVEETGRVRKIQNNLVSAVLTIQGVIISEDLRIGDSVAVNGVCLTVSGCLADGFTADVMHETLNRSSLCRLKEGEHVNLERAMPVNGRFGGHIVSGHIDGTGVITKIKKDANAIWYTISARADIMRYIVEKGAVAIDGISLTIAAVSPESFSVSVIPHTARSTVLGGKHIGSIVNLENDIIGKYVEKLILRDEKQKGNSRITKEFLAGFGF